MCSWFDIINPGFISSVYDLIITLSIIGPTRYLCTNHDFPTALSPVYETVFNKA